MGTVTRVVHDRLKSETLIFPSLVNYMGVDGTFLHTPEVIPSCHNTFFPVFLSGQPDVHLQITGLKDLQVTFRLLTENVYNSIRGYIHQHHFFLLHNYSPGLYVKGL